MVADWTARMYAEHGAVHHLDVTSGATLYRVFLLASTLQVDLAFAPAAEFRAIAPTFRLLFGTAAEPAIARQTLPKIGPTAAQDGWKPAEMPQGVFTWISASDFDMAGHGVAGGGHGLILTTSDFGKKWEWKANG